jgi:hypothetical protein
VKQTQTVKKTYVTPTLTKHQRLQKVTLGTVTNPLDAWLLPGQ